MIFYQIVKGFLVPTYADESGRGPDGQQLLTRTEAAEKFGVEPEVIGEVTKAFSDGCTSDYRETDPIKPLTSQDEWKLLRRVKFGHLNNEHFDLLRFECERRGLSLWGRHVHAEPKWTTGKRKPELLIIVTIDAMRSLANGTGQYAGQLGPWWAGPDREWKECWTGKGEDYPAFAKVGILRRDMKEPFWGIARWESYALYVEHDGRMMAADFWHRMAPEQLAKCAESLGFRKAFPEPMNGLYSQDEMAQRNNPRREEPELVGAGLRIVPDKDYVPRDDY